MLAVENGPPPSLPAAPRRANRIPRAGRVIGCPIGGSALLVIGTGGPMPDAALATLDDDPAGMSPVINWRLATPLPNATHGFAALVSANGADRTFATVQLEQNGVSKRYVFVPRTASVNEAAALLAELCGGRLAPTIDALADLLIAAPSDPNRLSTIVALVKAAHGSNGFIELLGESQDGEIFVQGWAHDVMHGVGRAVACGVGTSAAECSIAAYPRQDIPQGASAFAGLLNADGPINPGSIEGLVCRGRHGWRHMAVHERKLVAGPLETPAHIRSVLTRAQGTPQALLRLRSAASGFDGTETVSSLPLPVRMGVDDALQVGDASFLVSGWLLDPDGHVQNVKLRRHKGEARLDDGWSRLDRTDVADSFAEHPAFSRAFGHGSHRHGFVAHARLPDGDASSALYLELTLRDTRRAFLPLSPLRTTGRLAAMRQMRAIDPSDWALLDITDRQIVPLLCMSERVSPTVEAVVDLGPFEAAAGPPIVIGVGESDERGIAPLLALLAIDPETKRAPIALVVSSERFHRQVARMGKLAAFYGLSLRLVSAGETGDAYDLLEAGARALSSDTVVLLSGSLVPPKSGWYRKLVDTQTAHENSIVSPTLAYEDYSIRWAGTWPSRRYEGYPISAVAGLELTPVAAASLDCCVMPREAILRAGGFAGGYLGAREKGLDLSLRLGRSGVASYWLPSVTILGSDETSSVGTSAMAALVESTDRKIFDARVAAGRIGDANPSEGLRA